MLKAIFKAVFLCLKILLSRIEIRNNPKRRRWTVFIVHQALVAYGAASGG